MTFKENLKYAIKKQTDIAKLNELKTNGLTKILAEVNITTEDFSAEDVQACILLIDSRITELGGTP